MKTRAPFQPKPNTTCATVMELAKQRNSRALMQLEKQGIALDEQDGGRDAVSYLAEAGDFDTVDYLMERFVFPKESVLFGAAVGGFHEKVEALHETYYEKAIRNGYALGGYINEVNALLSRRVSLQQRDEKRYNPLEQIILNALRETIYGLSVMASGMAELIHYYELNGSEKCRAEIEHFYLLTNKLAGETFLSKGEVIKQFHSAILLAAAEKGDHERAALFGLPLDPLIMVSGYAMGGFEDKVIAGLDGLKKEIQAVLKAENVTSLQLASMLSRFKHEHDELVKNTVYSSAELACETMSQFVRNIDIIILALAGAKRNQLALILLGFYPIVLKYRAIISLTRRERYGYSLDDQALEGRTLDDFNDIAFDGPPSNERIHDSSLECLQQYLDGKWSLGYVLNYQPDKTISKMVLIQAEKLADCTFDSYFFTLMQDCFDENNFQLLNAIVRALPEVKRQTWLNTLKEEAGNVVTVPDNDILLVCSSIDDEEVRDAYITSISPYKLAASDRESMGADARVINRFRREYLLDFTQAKGLMSADPSAVTWMTVARPSLHEQLTSLVFLSITEALLGVNERDAKAIYSAILQRIFDRQPSGMKLQARLNVFGLFQPAPLVLPVAAPSPTRPAAGFLGVRNYIYSP